MKPLRPNGQETNTHSPLMAPPIYKSDSAPGRHNQPRLLFSETIHSCTDAIEPTVERMVGEIGRLISVDGHREAIDLALREAVVNAVVHGNRCNPDKLVEVACYRMPNQTILLVVRDQGTGFDPTHIADPTLPENLQRSTGRGIYLIRRFMDEVEFHEGGREIRMKKKC